MISTVDIITIVRLASFATFLLLILHAIIDIIVLIHVNNKLDELEKKYQREFPNDSSSTDSYSEPGSGSSSADS